MLSSLSASARPSPVIILNMAAAGGETLLAVCKTQELTSVGPKPTDYCNRAKHRKTR